MTTSKKMAKKFQNNQSHIINITLNCLFHNNIKKLNLINNLNFFKRVQTNPFEYAYHGSDHTNASLYKVP